MKWKEAVWPVIGIGAAIGSGWLLYRELRSLSLAELVDSLKAVTALDWTLCVLGALVAYAALAAYDAVALAHLRKRLPWPFITVASFTTYALSHNIGASVLSGAVVRYRAYTSKGLTGGEVGVLVVFCSLTFALGAILLGAVLLLTEPEVMTRFFPDLPVSVAFWIGAAMAALIALYAAGSFLPVRSLRLGSTKIDYPRPKVIGVQLLVAPIEIIGAAAIIYFALPEAGNPGFYVVLGIFVASFSAALVSHAPGGLGVLEFLFLTGLSEMNGADVLAALLVFRLLYLLIPFAISILVVLIFERAQFLQPRPGSRPP